MKKYQVEFVDRETGAMSPVDFIEVDGDYTEEDYIYDCACNGADVPENVTVVFIEVKRDFYEMASNLFDGGWRSEDEEQLANEYGLTEYEAAQICDILKEMEEA